MVSWKESAKRPSGPAETRRDGGKEVEGITLSSPRSPIPSGAITILGTSSKEFLISVYNVDCSDNIAVAKSWDAAEVQF